MVVKMQIKWIDQKTILIHFENSRPNIRGEKFRLFVEKLERALNSPLRGVRIVLSPRPLRDFQVLQINWSRFDNYGFKLKDFIVEE